MIKRSRQMRRISEENPLGERFSGEQQVEGSF
jgi:hypothetical protein